MEEEQKAAGGKYLKAAIIVSIFLLALGGLWVFIFKYRQLYSRISGNIDRGSLQQRVENPENISREYRAKSKEIVTAYISQSPDFLAEGGLSQETIKTRNALLSLKVSAEYRAKHLAMVLMLEEIDRLFRDGDINKASLKLEEFRVLAESEIEDRQTIESD